MPSLLISGPAGAGKTQIAREALAAMLEPAVVADFQQLYSALLLLERQPDGRYPERRDADRHVLSLAEYVRRAAITGAIAREVAVIVTNSDGSSIRRTELLSLLDLARSSRWWTRAEQSWRRGCRWMGSSRTNAERPLTAGTGVVMDTLLCEVRFAVDETRQSPGRLVGTLVNYEERANDRPEILARGSLHWPQEGLVINDQHDRKRAIVRTTHSWMGMLSK